MSYTDHGIWKLLTGLIMFLSISSYIFIFTLYIPIIIFHTYGFIIHIYIHGTFCFLFIWKSLKLFQLLIWYCFYFSVTCIYLTCLCPTPIFRSFYVFLFYMYLLSLDFNSTLLFNQACKSVIWGIWPLHIYHWTYFYCALFFNTFLLLPFIHLLLNNFP